MTEKAKHTNQPEDISEFSLTGVRAALLECLGCCPDCAVSVSEATGYVMVAPGGSFPSNSADATKPTNIIPLRNPHTRTTGFQGTIICMAEPPGTKSAAYDLPSTLLRKTLNLYFAKILSLVIVGEAACVRF